MAARASLDGDDGRPPGLDCADALASEPADVGVGDPVAAAGGLGVGARAHARRGPAPQGARGCHAVARHASQTVPAAAFVSAARLALVGRTRPAAAARVRRQPGRALGGRGGWRAPRRVARLRAADGGALVERRGVGGGEQRAQEHQRDHRA